MDDLDLKRFNIKSLASDAVILIVGKRRSGKSWLIRDIMYHFKNIPKGVVFSGTDESSQFFTDFIPDSFIHNSYKGPIVENMLLKQKKKIRKNKLEKIALDTDGKTKKNNVFIIMDDVLDDAQAWKKEKSLKSIFFNGRHMNIFYILAIQDVMGIPQPLRQQADYVFLYGNPSQKRRKVFYEEFCSYVPSFDHFCNIFDACTNKHECLVVKVSGGSNKVEENLFWYQASARNNFKACSPVCWQFHKKNYNQYYDDKNDYQEQKLLENKRKFGASMKKFKVHVTKQGEFKSNYPITEI